MPVKGVIDTHFSGLAKLGRGVLEIASRGGVIVAEEGLIEVVDAGVERGNADGHFLSEFGRVREQDMEQGEQ